MAITNLLTPKTRYTTNRNFLDSKDECIGFKQYTKSNLENIDVSSYKIDEHITVSVHDFNLKFPIKLIRIAKAVNNAKWILDLENGWDANDAQEISAETFKAAITFLKDYSCYLADRGTFIETPEINPVKSGTVDFEWHTGNAQMLINIQKRGNIYYAFYYGDRYNDEMPIKGNVPLSEFSEALAVWMKYLV